MRMISFAPQESPRSIQLYGTEPVSLAEAVRYPIAEGGLDHIDMNFGCPAPKVTRNGGRSAVPLKRNRFWSIVKAAEEDLVILLAKVGLSPSMFRATK